MSDIVYSTGLGGELNLLEPAKEKEKVDDWQFIEPISNDDLYEMDEEFARSMEDDDGLIEDSMLAGLDN